MYKRALGPVVFLAMIAAFAGHYVHASTMTFAASAVALIGLSKVLGDATEQLSHYVGQRLAGFVNVSLSNLAELIILYVAVREGMIGLVQGGIVGSIVGNIMLVMGLSIYFGCRKNGSMKFDQSTASLSVQLFYLAASTLMLATLFVDRITPAKQETFSDLLALMLIGAYAYFYWVMMTDPRYKRVGEQAHELNHRWPKSIAIAALVGAATGAFFMSEFLVHEIEPVARAFSFSPQFMGFILVPLMSNIAEHFVAITAARKRMTELSLTVAIGSASQVAMVVAPCTVLYGIITGNAVSLNFTALPLGLFIMSVIGAYLVLKDGEWHEHEGVMLLMLYGAVVIGFWFTQ